MSEKEENLHFVVYWIMETEGYNIAVANEKDFFPFKKTEEEEKLNVNKYVW